MFYCESCAKEHGYPFDPVIMLVSRGPCELCKKTASCVDVPSSRLPRKEPETVPCEICGESTTYTGTKRCNNCYEVESRLDTFLHHPKALQLIVRKIRENELKQGAAEAIEHFDEDELERYSSELRAAQSAVIEGHIEDIMGWAVRGEADELRAFISGALNIDRMTLAEIKGKFSSYLADPDPDEIIPYVPVPSLWDNDLIQFARLLCEIRAACEMEGFDQVMESMDLDDEQMDELWKRAEAVWEKAKADHCPPPKAETGEEDRVGEGGIPKCPHCMVVMEVDPEHKDQFHCPKCSSSFQSLRVRCDDCGWKGRETDLDQKLEEIDHLTERLDVGGEVPAGTCPKCNALCYLERADNKVIPHLDHVEFLEVAFYGREEGKKPDSVTVECTKCGEVVHEIFNAEFEG